MKVVIPAKGDSVRVPNKNWKEFYQGKNLVELRLLELLEIFAPNDIYVSCEDESRREEIADYGVNFWLRDPKFSQDETIWSEVVTGIIESIPCDDEEEILWNLVTCPFFQAIDFKGTIARWRSIPKDLYDCLITVEPFKEFVLDKSGRPMNFQFGHWHQVSQDLPKWATIKKQCHIMKKKTFLRYNYDIGMRPYLYEIASRPSVDIDNEHEFRYAQYLYGEMNAQPDI